MSAEAARQALEEAHRLLDTYLDEVTPEPEDLVKCIKDVRYMLDHALREQPSPDAALIEALDHIKAKEKTAREQQIATPQYAEFWRGRAGALHDALVWLAAARAGETPA